MKKKNIYFDVTGIETTDEYYTKKSITKALAGIPQTNEEISTLINNITTSVVDELFKGDTVAVYKQNNVLIRIPKSAITTTQSEPQEEPKKKPGFLKRLWNKIFG